MLQSSDFEVGDIVKLLSSGAKYGAHRANETAIVLTAGSGALLQIRFEDGRTEKCPARMVMLMSRPKRARPE